MPKKKNPGSVHARQKKELENLRRLGPENHNGNVLHAENGAHSSAGIGVPGSEVIVFFEPSLSGETLSAGSSFINDGNEVEESNMPNSLAEYKAKWYRKDEKGRMIDLTMEKLEIGKREFTQRHIVPWGNPEKG